ncbi:MAG: DUF4364 family protein [Clostridia bacterium]|nr:DUF4364 family protein [Clostridia bacterium]
MAFEPPKRPAESKQRLLLLLILDKLGRCSDMQLLQFLFDQDLMNYFDMMFTLNDLCDQGLTQRLERIGQTFYQLTEAGKETLNLFENRLPASQRELIKELSPQWRTRVQREQDFQSDYHQTKRGEYELHLRVMEQDMEMVHISLSLPSEEIARTMKENWPEHAESIYAGLFNRLGEKKA